METQGVFVGFESFENQKALIQKRKARGEKKHFDRHLQSKTPENIYILGEGSPII